MMNKILKNTSKTEYSTPILIIDELEKQDILTASAEDNGSVEGSSVKSNHKDAFDGFSFFVE